MPYTNRTCLNCEELTENPRFCSRSCSASYHNSKNPKRTWTTQILMEYTGIEPARLACIHLPLKLAHAPLHPDPSASQATESPRTTCYPLECVYRCHFGTVCLRLLNNFTAIQVSASAPRRIRTHTYRFKRPQCYR